MSTYSENNRSEETINVCKEYSAIIGKEIYIINPKSNVKKIFTITGLDKIFKVEG